MICIRTGLAFTRMLSWTTGYSPILGAMTSSMTHPIRADTSPLLIRNGNSRGCIWPSSLAAGHVELQWLWKLLCWDLMHVWPGSNKRWKNRKNHVDKWNVGEPGKAWCSSKWPNLPVRLDQSQWILNLRKCFGMCEPVEEEDFSLNKDVWEWLWESAFGTSHVSPFHLGRSRCFWGVGFVCVFVRFVFFFCVFVCFCVFCLFPHVHWDLTSLTAVGHRQHADSHTFCHRTTVTAVMARTASDQKKLQVGESWTLTVALPWSLEDIVHVTRKTIAYSWRLPIPPAFSQDLFPSMQVVGHRPVILAGSCNKRQTWHKYQSLLPQVW